MLNLKKKKKPQKEGLILLFVWSVMQLAILYSNINPEGDPLHAAKLKIACENARLNIAMNQM